MGTEDLITAKQAKNCVNTYKKVAIDNEIKKVKDAIEAAVRNREYKTYITGYINKETRNIFENLGYKIETISFRNETETIIDWSGK